MTTPEPRVQVTKNPWMELDCTPWSAHCPYCAGPDRFEWRYTWGAAMADAIEHATEEPCDGLRLARLLRELETLRDSLRNDWQNNAQMAADFRTANPGTANWCDGASYICKATAADLTAIIDRAGGTG